MPGDGELAVLFADLASSTQLYETFGNETGKDLVSRCVATMMATVNRHGGTVVRVIGDEVLTTFPTADAAIAAAVDMQDTVTATLAPDRRPLAIRIGLHSGPVLIEDAELYGDAVNVAARMVTQAKPSQILTTGATVAAISASLQASCRLVDRVAVKGKRHPIDVFEMVWQVEEATLMHRSPVSERAAGGGGCMVLSGWAARVELSEAQPTLSIGRGEQNDLVVAEAIVSRLHARAEYRKGRFTIIDQSANGTFIVPDDGAAMFIRRDTYVLTGSGTLGLGERPTVSSGTSVRYEVREA